jgi:serine/threonine-protein kinase
VGAGRSGPYCWIAREYVEGESLARLIHRSKEAGKFDWTRACRLAVQIGKALYFLHEHKVTHGNITPRNILIRGADKVAKLADLMLNQALEGSKLQKTILGQKLVAELPYLAPEQTDPHATVAPRSDFYSLGVVLYAMLTGQPPFMGDTPKEILSQIREGKPEKPSKLQKGIPPDFEAAVLKMMARRPEDRFPSAVDMLGVVETIALEQGVQG